ncbi:hypothetical protein ABBQ32_011102 [Trebouxia sp. C0010 RCD-2024]
MLALQLQLQQMGVERIFLDAAGEDAKSVWCALGFLVITDSQYKVLACQYCLVLNQYIAARCLQLVPNEAALLAQGCAKLHPSYPSGDSQETDAE